MSLYETNKLFETTYLDRTNNVFEAINMWVDDANRLCRKYRNRISNSESLSSLLTCELPHNLESRKIVADVEQRYIDKYIQEVISQIDDADVKISVIRTLNHSRGVKKLEFCYLNNLSQSQRSRVRIICKLIWFNLYPQKGENDG